MTKHEDVAGTLAEMLPQLRALGFVGVRTMGGHIPFETFDPYGLSGPGGKNWRKAEDTWRGVLAEDAAGRWYLLDVPKDGRPVVFPFVLGAFPLERGH